MTSLNLKLPFDYRISECLNRREKLNKQIKYYSLILYYVLYISQYVFIYFKLGSLKPEEIPLYYFGIYHQLGGLSQFYYLSVTFCSSYSVQYLYIFNRNHKYREKWIKL